MGIILALIGLLIACVISLPFAVEGHGYEIYAIPFILVVGVILVIFKPQRED